MMGAEMQIVANLQQDVGIIGVTKCAGAFDNGLERRCDVGRRRRDHFQHVGGRGLLLQGLAEIVRALPQLIEETDILDRDYRLVGEGGDEIDLLLRERLDPLPREHNGSDRFVLTQQGHAKCGVLAGKRSGFVQCIFGIGRDVCNLDRALLDHRAAGDRAPIHGQGVIPEKFDIRLGVADGGAGPVLIAFAAHDEGHFGVAQPRCRRYQRIEHGLQIERRTADGFQHVTDRRLLL